MAVAKMTREALPSTEMMHVLESASSAATPAARRRARYHDEQLLAARAILESSERYGVPDSALYRWALAFMARESQP